MKTFYLLLALASGLACTVEAADDLEFPAPSKAARQAITLLNQGKVEDAEAALTAHLKAQPDDVSARLLLGQVLDFDGRPDEAIRLWTKGLHGKPADMPLLMQIGQLQARLGEHGPTVTQRRGAITAKPNRDAQASAKFKQERYKLAAEAYSRALELDPDAIEPAKALAQTYTALEDHASALKVWQRLYDLDAANVDAAMGVAAALEGLGESDKSAEVLRALLKTSPRISKAHDRLASYYRNKGDEASAAESERQAKFYAALPTFTKLMYTAENAETLARLGDKTTVESLMKDPGEDATEMLAALCWQHPHNALEDMAFAELERRGEKAVPVVRSLFLHGRSTCTIRGSARILARQQDPQIFERLLQLLPGDMRMTGFEMDIAGALAELQDPRAIDPLIALLDPTNHKEEPAGSPESFLVDRYAARARAAFALGAFESPEATKALTQGLDHPRLGTFCAAALYRTTKQEKYLKQMQASIAGNDRYAAYLLSTYLPRIDTPEAKALLDEWEARRAKERAKDKKPAR